MLSVIVKKNNATVIEHDLHSVSSANGYTHTFLTGGFVAVNLQINDFVDVEIFDDGSSVMHIFALFESYQFSMSSYTSNGEDGNEEGSTHSGVTNNSLVFRNISILGS